MIPSEKVPRRPGRPRKGERGDTRQELLDAALELFAKQGYAATTVRQIAHVVGVRDSAIYGHFEGKRELFDLLVERSSETLVESLGVDPDNPSSRPPAEVLPDLSARLIDAWDEPRARQTLSVVIREEGERMTDASRELRQLFLPYIRRWVERGFLRADVSPEQLVWELVVPLTAIRLGRLRFDTTREDRARARELARCHVEYFLVTSAPS